MVDILLTATSKCIVPIIAPITQHLNIIVDHILEVRNQVEVEVKVVETAQSLVEVALSLVEVKVAEAILNLVEAALNRMEVVQSVVEVALNQV